MGLALGKIANINYYRFAFYSHLNTIIKIKTSYKNVGYTEID
jgi:hypothetical protein